MIQSLWEKRKLFLLLRHLLSMLASAVPTGIAVPVISGPLAGAKWYSGAAAGYGKGLSVCLNLCEPEQMSAALELSKGAEICFDIGANVGLYSLLFSRTAKSVFAFEPLPRNLVWLYRVLTKNRVSNVTPVPAAVSSSVCVASFEEGENCAAGKISPNGTPVLCVSVDAFAEKVGMPDLMKIDVEGGELSVLLGAQNVLTRRRPTILLSTHGDTVKHQCLEFLELFGYVSKPLNADGMELLCTANDHSCAQNSG